MTETILVQQKGPELEITGKIFDAENEQLLWIGSDKKIPATRANLDPQRKNCRNDQLQEVSAISWLDKFSFRSNPNQSMGKKSNLHFTDSSNKCSHTDRLSKVKPII